MDKENDEACKSCMSCYDPKCQRTGQDYEYCFIRYLYYEPRITEKQKKVSEEVKRCPHCHQIIK